MFAGSTGAHLWPMTILRREVYLAMQAADVDHVSPTGAKRTFHSIYLTHGSEEEWGIHLSRVDALLVAIGTLTTAGTNGVTPRSEVVRELITLQMTVDIAANRHFRPTGVSIGGGKTRACAYGCEYVPAFAADS
ncbi:MAG: hypothetical protein M3O90_06255 [Actinomycetota bacterium]|nr:hypothetical protein [Actinomycetota bacterium]